MAKRAACSISMGAEVDVYSMSESIVPGVLVPPLKKSKFAQFQMAQPVPGPMTPTCSPSSPFDDEDDAISILDFHADGCFQKLYMDLQSTRAPTKTIGTSTTPSTTPPSSPPLMPSAPPVVSTAQLSFPFGYDCLSTLELRAELGVAGTDMALDWSHDEFSAVLEEIDRVCMPIMLDDSESASP